MDLFPRTFPRLSLLKHNKKLSYCRDSAGRRSLQASLKSVRSLAFNECSWRRSGVTRSYHDDGNTSRASEFITDTEVAWAGMADCRRRLRFRNPAASEQDQSTALLRQTWLKRQSGYIIHFISPDCGSERKYRHIHTDIHYTYEYTNIQIYARSRTTSVVMTSSVPTRSGESGSWWERHPPAVHRISVFRGV